MKLRLSLPKILNVTLYTDGNCVFFASRKTPQLFLGPCFMEICSVLLHNSGIRDSAGGGAIFLYEKSNKFVSEKVFSRGSIGQLRLPDLAELTE